MGRKERDEETREERSGVGRPGRGRCRLGWSLPFFLLLSFSPKCALFALWVRYQDRTGTVPPRYNGILYSGNLAITNGLCGNLHPYSHTNGPRYKEYLPKPRHNERKIMDSWRSWCDCAGVRSPNHAFVCA